MEVSPAHTFQIYAWGFDIIFLTLSHRCHFGLTRNPACSIKAANNNTVQRFLHHIDSYNIEIVFRIPSMQVVCKAMRLQSEITLYRLISQCSPLLYDDECAARSVGQLHSISSAGFILISRSHTIEQITWRTYQLHF